MLERSLQLAHSMTRAASNVANANGETNQIFVSAEEYLGGMIT
jgi:hypothetical protein